MHLNKIINIVYNDSKFSVDTFNYLKTKLLELDYTVPHSFDYTADLTICIGGDGSFLRAIHQYNFTDIPIVGINTGHLGFFTEINPNEIDDFLSSYVKGDYFIEEINPVEAVICTRSNCINALGLNEIVIKGDKSRTVHLDISVNDNLIQRFSGDGILVANSTGSTAYNYSVGGSIVDPSISVLQVTPLAPINTTAYRSFTSSVILPPNAAIKVNPEYHYEDSIVIVSDGMEYRYRSITEILLKLSEVKVRMLRLKNFEFWSKAKEKFL